MKWLVCGSIILWFVSMFVGVASTEPQSQLPQLQSQSEVEEVAVHIPNSTLEQANTIAETHGYDNMGQIGELKDYYLFKHKHAERRKRRDAMVALKEDQQIAWLEPQSLLNRVKRQVTFNDPLFLSQWYFVDSRTTMKIRDAWKAGFSGRNVVVAIVDDGLDKDHLDLKRNYDPEASHDFNSNDNDPTPRNNGFNMHGTRCAGVAAAQAGDGICGVGVAYKARIGGIRMLDGPITDALEAKSMGYAPQHIDIYVASWGPNDNGKSYDGPGVLAEKAFLNGIQNGRQGRGSIYVWAGGNGGFLGDSCACDGYTTNIYAITINSVTSSNKKPWYAETCPGVMASTYSSGFDGTPAVISTDFPGGCTKQHTGTSASAPMAAGVIALALEANPKLTWRDVQHLIVRTANPASLLSNDGWKTNGVGRKVSGVFGYGLLDAEAMVKMARKWRTVPPQVTCRMTAKVPSSSRRLKGRFKKSFQITFGGCPSGGLNYIEHVHLYVNVQYRQRGSLQIMLTSPQKTRSVMLPPRRMDSGPDTLFGQWPFMSVQQWGEKPKGTWVLNLSNTGSSSNSGVIQSYTLVVYGTQKPPQR